MRLVRIYLDTHGNLSGKYLSSHSAAKPKINTFKYQVFVRFSAQQNYSKRGAALAVKTRQLQALGMFRSSV